MGVLKSPTIIIQLSTFLFMSVNICFLLCQSCNSCEYEGCMGLAPSLADCEAKLLTTLGVLGGRGSQ